MATDQEYLASLEQIVTQNEMEAENAEARAIYWHGVASRFRELAEGSTPPPPPPENKPPTISGIGDQVGKLGTIIGPFSFTVSDDGPLEEISVRAVSSEPAVVRDDGIGIAGSRDRWSIAINPVGVGVAPITLIVTDGSGLSTSWRFTVTVEQAEDPDPGPIPVPNPDLSAPYSGIQRIGLGVDSDGVSHFAAPRPEKVAIVGSTSEMLAALDNARRDLVDEIQVNRDGVIIPRNALSGIHRPAELPLVIRGRGMPRITQEIHDDKASCSGIAFCSLLFPSVVQWRGKNWSNVLYEDVEGWWDVQGERLGPTTDGELAFNAQLRRFTAKNHATTDSSHRHGVFAYNCDLLLQYGLLDHNGWRGDDRNLPLDQGGPSIRKHNIYLSRPMGRVVVHRVLSARPSATAFLGKHGGDFDECIALDAPIGFQPGTGGDGYYDRYGLAKGSMRRCIQIGGADINPANEDFRGIFCWLNCVDDVLVADCIAAENNTSRVNDAVFWADRRTAPFGRARLVRNRAYGWPGGIFRSPGTSPIDLVEQENWLDLAMTTGLTSLASDVRSIVYSTPSVNGVTRAFIEDVLSRAFAG